MKIKKLHILTLVCAFSAKLFSQQTDVEYIAGNYYEDYNFNKAAEVYNSSEALSLNGKRRLADSYVKLGKYKEAEEVYSKIMFSQGTFTEDLYAYSSILKLNGKYEEAYKWLKKYKELKPQDLRVKNYTFEKPELDRLLKDDKRFKIVNIPQNSSFDDFGTTFYNDKIIFTSNRTTVAPIKRTYNWNGKGFYDIYLADTVNNDLVKARPLIKQINKKYHEGPAAYSTLDKTIAYTKNNYEGKSKEGYTGLEIFFKSIRNNEWQPEVPFSQNSNDYSVGQPWLSYDGNTIIFASNMPGGFGGVDLYKSTRDYSGVWSKAQNLGPNVNTEGDEMFPYYEEISGNLFFASNGLQGLGGLDIFVSPIKKDTTYGRAFNIGIPINSQYDDFSFIIDDNLRKGYFSSNRPGGKGGDDIYYFESLRKFIFQKVIKGVAIDEKGEPISNAEIALVGDKDSVYAQITTKEDGKFSFEVSESKPFQLTGSKSKYKKAINTISTLGSEDVIYSDLKLEKIANILLHIIAVDNTTKKPLEGVKIVMLNNFVDKADSIITPVSGDVKIPLTGIKLNENISYNITLEKDGYVTKTVTYNKKIEKEGQYDLAILFGKIDVGVDLAKLIEIKPIYFDLGKFNIRSDAAVELDKVVKIMNENPKMEVELGSHTDCRGTAAENRELSDKRAKASAKYIKDRITNPERITGKGYGESKLINSCKCEGGKSSFCSEEEHQLNRRTEFIVKKAN